MRSRQNSPDQSRDDITDIINYFTIVLIWVEGEDILCQFCLFIRHKAALSCQLYYATIALRALIVNAHYLTF